MEYPIIHNLAELENILQPCINHDVNFLQGFNIHNINYCIQQTRNKIDRNMTINDETDEIYFMRFRTYQHILQFLSSKLRLPPQTKTNIENLKHKHEKIPSLYSMAKHQLSTQDIKKAKEYGIYDEPQTGKGLVNKWISHVKEFSKAHKIKYGDALRHSQCKATYIK